MNNKRKKIKYGYYCPYCGNEVPYAVRNDRNIKFVRCNYCKISFPKYEIVKEKE